MVGNHDAHHKQKRSETGVEIRSRYHVHSACAADLVAADDFAHAGDANRFAWSDLLPSGARRLGGRHFSIWKFRTMQVSAETQTHEHYFRELMRVDRPMTKLDAYGDPRLAPFGRFLRASGLDELPQIFNVLCGEVSLVGPRPCTPNEFAHYEPWQLERVNGLPGLTGYWQVNGKNKTTFNEMIMMDLFYLENMSILLDVKIMLKTGAVIAGQLLEFQRGHNVIVSGADGTKFEREGIPTSVPGTAIRMGFETDRATKAALGHNGFRSTRE
jgi:lipopolysaccharide/colanic/teichoic acid biosynthesis glycosyltransferase